MRRFKPVALILLLITLMLFVFFPVHAADAGMETEKINEEEIPVIFNRLRLRSIDAPKKYKRFSCFDVNEEGQYMLGIDGLQDLILVFDADGKYLYGFSMIEDGGFNLEWDGTNIIIYCVRGDLAVTIDKYGNCLEMRKILNTTKNSRYWRQLSSAEKESAGCTYIAEHELDSINIFGGHWGSYPRLLRTSSDGEKTVLYEGSPNKVVIIFGCGAILGFILICLYFIRILISKKKKPKDTSAGSIS